MDYQVLISEMTSSFVICTKNRLQDLLTCVDSIRDQTVLPKELVIVDAGNIKDIENIIRCRLTDSNIKFIYQKAEPSTARQRNIGVKLASGEIILFVDDDVILERNYHEKILEVYKKHEGPYLGGVCGTIANAGEFVETPFMERFRRLFLLNHHTIKGRSMFLPSGHYVFVAYPETVIEVEAMESCRSSYYRHVFNKYNFDDSWPGYSICEDLELSYRISRKYKQYQTPYARLIHKRSPVSRLKTYELQRLYVINHFLMFNKNISKNVINISAFVWSRIGDAVINIGRSIVRRDRAYIAGYMCGIKEIIVKLCSVKI